MTADAETIGEGSSMRGYFVWSVGLMVVGLAAGAAAQVVTLVVDLNVVDATGNVIARTDSTGNARLNLQTARGLVSLTITRDQISSSKRGPFFTSADCTGTPYLVSDLPLPLDGASAAAGVVRLPGWTLYLPTGAPPVEGGMQSELLSNGSCSPGGLGDTVTFHPAEAAVDLATLFTAPFRVEPAASAASACCGDCDGGGSVEISELIAGVNHALNGCTP